MDYSRHYTYDDSIKRLGLSVRAYNYCLYLKIRTVGELLNYYSSNNYTIPRGHYGGPKTITELQEVCQLLQSTTPPDSIKDNNDVYPVLIPSTPSTEIQEEDKQQLGDSINYDLIKKRGINSTIQDWGVSVRAYNVCQAYRLTTRESLLDCYLKNGNTIPNNLNNCGKKTILELESLCKELLSFEDNTYYENTSSYDEQPVLSVADIQYSTPQNNIDPFTDRISSLLTLNENEKQFLIDFYNLHNHYPVLWLIRQYINNNSDVYDYALFYQIDHAKTDQELSTLTKEEQDKIKENAKRGYNILFNPRSEFNRCINSIDNSYLTDCLKGIDLLTPIDEFDNISVIIRDEESTLDKKFIVGYIINLYGGYSILDEHKRNKYDFDKIYVSDDLNSYFDFDAYRKGLELKIEEATEYIELNLRIDIEDSPYWLSFSISNVNRVLKAVKAFVFYKYGLYELDMADTIDIVPKKIDLKNIVFNIVSNSIMPLSLDDIINEALKQYPNYSFPVNTVIKVLRENPQIHFRRGNGSIPTVYMLASNETPSSIRDAIIRVLSGFSTPLKLDDIVNHVLSYFPSSNKRSIKTSILNDTLNRFVQFKGDFYGLSSKKYPETYIPVTQEESRLSFEERLILLKHFLDENERLPFIDSDDKKEQDLARWTERYQKKEHVKELLNKYKAVIWKTECLRCEEYIVSHNGKIPNLITEPRLFKWLTNAISSLSNDSLDQEQRRQLLHLCMQIRR